MNSPRPEKNTNILLQKKIKQLTKQLDLSKKTCKKLRKDKNKLSKEMDKMRGEKGKLETQLNWKNLQFKRRQKEFETSKRHELWKLKHELYKNRGNIKLDSSKKKIQQTQQTQHKKNNNIILTNIDFEDPEINELFNKVYRVETSIQSSLSRFNYKNTTFNKATDYLDNSFDTISLLLQESKAQKAIIHQLNTKIKMLQQSLLSINNNQNNDNNNDNIYSQQLQQLKNQLIQKNQIIKQLKQNKNNNIINDNINNKYIDYPKQIQLLQKNNMEYEDKIHSLQFEIEKLKNDKIISDTNMESYKYQIENLETISKSQKEQNNLMIKRLESIRFENNTIKNELRKYRNNINIQQIDLHESTSCF